MKTFRNTIVSLAIAVLLLPATAVASLHVTPGDLPAPFSGLEGPSTPAVEAAAAAAAGLSTAAFTATELYRINSGDPQIEEKALAGSYTGSIFPVAPPDNDLVESQFSITYDGGDAIDPTWLLIKDGKHNPIWYLFDISTWDGISTLSGAGFWPTGGAISHVSVYGERFTPNVPEPSTAMVWGLLAVTGYFGANRWRGKS